MGYETGVAVDEGADIGVTVGVLVARVVGVAVAAVNGGAQALTRIINARGGVSRESWFINVLPS